MPKKRQRKNQRRKLQRLQRSTIGAAAVADVEQGEASGNESSGDEKNSGTATADLKKVLVVSEGQPLMTGSLNASEGTREGEPLLLPTQRPAQPACYNRPLLSSTCLAHPVSAALLLGLLVVWETAFTGAGYYTLNVGQDQPQTSCDNSTANITAAYDPEFFVGILDQAAPAANCTTASEDVFQQLTLNYTEFFVSISVLVNLIFTLVPLYQGVYRPALDQDSWLWKNLGLVALALIFGGPSAGNYVGNAEAAANNLLNDHPDQLGVYRAIQYGFVAAMMALNSVAAYDILKMLGAGAAGLWEGVKTIYASQYPLAQVKEYAVQLAKPIQQNPVTVLKLAATLYLGLVVMYPTLASYFFEKNVFHVRNLPRQEAAPMSDVMAIGNLFFGLVFGYTGLTRIEEGVRDAIAQVRASREHSAFWTLAVIGNQVFFISSIFVCALGTAVPSLSQAGSDSLARALMAIVAMVMNMPAVTRAVNAAAHLFCFFNVPEALRTLYVKTTEDPNVENRIGVGFNSDPAYEGWNKGWEALKSRLQRCCPKSRELEVLKGDSSPDTAVSMDGPNPSENKALLSPSLNGHGYGATAMAFASEGKSRDASPDQASASPSAPASPPAAASALRSPLARLSGMGNSMRVSVRSLLRSPPQDDSAALQHLVPQGASAAAATHPDLF